MTHKDPISERVLRIAEPACAAAGYACWDVKFTMEQGHWILRIFIDRADREGEVDLDDCERMSRELSAVLDVEDPIPQAYSLEISSPGIDRPLRTVDHFRRHVGEEVKVALERPLVVETGAERRNFKGVLTAVEGDDEVDAVAIVDVDGHPFRLPIRDVEQAKLVPDWDQVLGHKPKPNQQKQPKRKSKQARS